MAVTNNSGQLPVAELDWLSAVTLKRLETYFNKEAGSLEELLTACPPPKLPAKGSAYADFIRRHSLGPAERLVLILSIVPHVKPELLDVLLLRNQNLDKRFTEFGGVVLPDLGFLPTLQTALYLLGGERLEDRLSYAALFTAGSVLLENNVLQLSPVARRETYFSARLQLTDNYLSYFLTGAFDHPDFSEEFPARHVTTNMEWQDVVLKKQVEESVEEIRTWVEHGHVLMQDKNLGKRLRPGYKALFYGPPGTGKTLTAVLIGKSTGHDVYKVDLSTVVSKYIGETEKNLARLFDQAEQRNWILFFDEADALFGKRTSTNSSNDRYANQEVAYLLQRIEDFPGIVILATNLQHNIDEAFSRRFQCMVHFTMPGPEERYLLWKQSFPETFKLPADEEMRKVAGKYEIAGGGIVNVIRYCSLMAVSRKAKTISIEDVEKGIRRELVKEGILL